MKTYLYILDTLADWEIAHITAELNTGRFFKKGCQAIKIIKIADSMKPITTMGGIKIMPDVTIDKVSFQDDDLLILPGADTWMQNERDKIIEIVRNLMKTNVVVAAICGATIALATAGLLNNIKHTSNDLQVLEMYCHNYKGKANFIAKPAVSSDNLITASGVGELEFAYEIFKALNIMSKDTASLWYKLFKTQESKYYEQLMQSLH
jgi:putative intracellular protease/amidase